MNKEEIHWLAGYLEGEGSFLNKGKYCNLVICATSTDLDVLKKVQAIVNGRIYKTDRLRAYENGWKDAWVWQITDSDDCARIMRVLLPLMGQRRTSDIKKCIEAYEEYQTKLQEENMQVEARRNRVRELHSTGNYTHQEIGNIVELERSTVTYILNGRYD